MGLAGINEEAALDKLMKTHNEAHPLVGRNLAPLILGEDEVIMENEPVYFMTDDDPSKTLNSFTFSGEPFMPVTQPSHIETVITMLPTGKNREPEIWKYSRYFDNPQFWSSPGSQDQVTAQECTASTSENTDCSLCITTTKTTPVPDQTEMYNLTKDPYESRNLTYPEFVTEETTVIQSLLAKILSEQCKKKRLYPSSGSVPGKPSCRQSGRDILNL